MKIAIELDVFDHEQIKFQTEQKTERALKAFQRQINKDANIKGMLFKMKGFNLVYCANLNRFYGIGKLMKYMVK